MTSKTSLLRKISISELDIFFSLSKGKQLFKNIQLLNVCTNNKLQNHRNKPGRKFPIKHFKTRDDQSIGSCNKFYTFNKRRNFLLIPKSTARLLTVPVFICKSRDPTVTPLTFTTGLINPQDENGTAWILFKFLSRVQMARDRSTFRP